MSTSHNRNSCIFKLDLIYEIHTDRYFIDINTKWLVKPGENIHVTTYRIKKNMKRDVSRTKTSDKI